MTKLKIILSIMAVFLFFGFIFEIVYFNNSSQEKIRQELNTYIARRDELGSEIIRLNAIVKTLEAEINAEKSNLDAEQLKALELQKQQDMLKAQQAQQQAQQQVIQPPRVTRAS